MTNRVQTNRLSVAGSRPTAGSRAPGELYVNWPDMQAGYIDDSKNPNDLVAIRFFSATTTYNAGDLVVQGGHLWHANQTIPAGPFNPAQWDQNTTNNPGGSAYLPLTGGSMTGALLLASDPINALGAATKEYVDGKLFTGGFLPTAGGTITGNLTVNGNTNLQALSATGITAGSYGIVSNGNTQFNGGSNGMAGNLAVSGSLSAANLTLSGAASIGGGVTGYSFTATGAGGSVGATDRAGGGAEVVLYRSGNLGCLWMNECGNFLYSDTAGTVSVPGNFVAGPIWSRGPSAILYTQDRVGTNYGYMYRQGAALYIGNNEGGGTTEITNNFLVGGTGQFNSSLTVNGSVTMYGSGLYCPNLTTWGANFWAPGGYPLYIHSANGTNCYMGFTLDGVRTYYVGQGSDQQFRIYDASAGHSHITCSSDNHVVLGGATRVTSDFMNWGSNMCSSSCVYGYVGDGFASTAHYNGYTDFNHDSQNTNVYLSYYTINLRGAGVGSVTTDGGSTYYNTSSDGRRKKNIRKLANEVDIGKMIDAIEPVAFEWTHLPDEPTGHGFVAQDLAKVAPGAVWSGFKVLNGPKSHGEHPWGVDFSKLVPYMIAEMQALRKRVAELEAAHG